MREKRTSVAKGAQIGPRIVRAWFDSVINPLIHALEVETELLSQRNWTWRFRPQGLESIRPVRAYLDHASRDNLGQYLQLNPWAASLVKEHDRRVGNLLERCRRLHDSLLRMKDLRELYVSCTSPSQLDRLRVDRASLFGAYPEEDHLALLAELIVNNTPDLPLHYATAPLWNLHKDAFLALLKKARPHAASVNAAGKALLSAARRLLQHLKDSRLKLSLEHDVPYFSPAPLSPRAVETAF